MLAGEGADRVTQCGHDWWNLRQHQTFPFNWGGIATYLLVSWQRIDDEVEVGGIGEHACARRRPTLVGFAPVVTGRPQGILESNDSINVVPGHRWVIRLQFKDVQRLVRHSRSHMLLPCSSSRWHAGSSAPHPLAKPVSSAMWKRLAWRPYNHRSAFNVCQQQWSTGSYHSSTWHLLVSCGHFLAKIVRLRSFSQVIKHANLHGIQIMCRPAHMNSMSIPARYENAQATETDVHALISSEQRITCSSMSARIW